MDQLIIVLKDLVNAYTNVDVNQLFQQPILQPGRIAGKGGNRLVPCLELALRFKRLSDKLELICAGSSFRKRSDELVKRLSILDKETAQAVKAKNGNPYSLLLLPLFLWCTLNMPTLTHLLFV